MLALLAYFSLHPMPHMRTCSQATTAWAQTTMLNLGASLAVGKTKESNA